MVSESTLVTRIDPKDSLAGVTVSSMDFLNEVSDRFPGAISLAAGRPPNDFIRAEQVAGYISRYIAYRGGTSESGIKDAWTAIGQYAPTNGIIKDLVSDFLRAVEGVATDKDRLVITNGFQEALLIELMELAANGGALVALDPTYVGLTGAAMITGLPLYVVKAGNDVPASLAMGARAAIADGYNSISAYLIPDFDNPTGRSLDPDQRKALLDVAGTCSMTILEDVAYRFFNYEAARFPSLLNMDNNGTVAQLGSFSKFFMPGVRMGYVARRSSPRDKQPASGSLHTAIKSFTSVTTSPITQAIVGGFLLETGNKIDEHNHARLEFCRTNRDAMLAALEKNFKGNGLVKWSRPGGGFFLVVDLPFAFGEKETTQLAEQYGVIVTPLSFFSPTGRYTHQVRLSFSANSKEFIGEGVTRFAAYVNSHS